MFEELLEKTRRVNEVNIPARLASDDLISSFKEAYQNWETIYRDQLDRDDFLLAIKMITGALSQGFHVISNKRRYW